MEIHTNKLTKPIITLNFKERSLLFAELAQIAYLVYHIPTLLNNGRAITENKDSCNILYLHPYKLTSSVWKEHLVSSSLQINFQCFERTSCIFIFTN